MKTCHYFALPFAICSSFLIAASYSASFAQEKVTQPTWGTVTQVADQPGVYEAKITERPSGDRLPLPADFPHVVHCDLGADASGHPLDFEYDASKSRIVLIASAISDFDGTRPLMLSTAEASQQFADGRITFSALDAQVRGSTAKLEKAPGHYRIGFWTNSSDVVFWPYKATRWGRYLVRLTYATASPDGTEIEIAIADKKLPITLRSTGSWNRYTTVHVGPIDIKQEGDYLLNVRCTKTSGESVMNLKSITLQPISEGEPISQGPEGIISLHGRDSIVRGTVLRYEPAEIKQTLGYWVRPTDRAEWTFTVNTPGKYYVEVLQGCGTGQGGSEMELRIGDQTLNFEVIDTGHFQNFQQRILGEVELPAAGIYRLSVRPKRIAKAAAMDLRQVRLLPPSAFPLPAFPLPGERLEIAGRPGFVLLPPEGLRKTPQPWVFYAPTLPGVPDTHERWMHERFLAAGVAVAGVDVGEAYGSPLSHPTLDALYEQMVKQRHFAEKPCVLGRSRGGLWVSSWASVKPDRVAGLAGIYPVFDLRTYPGLANAASAYGKSPTDLEAHLNELNPIQRVHRLAEAKVPTFIIHGDVDEVVPLKENSAEYVARYRSAGAEDKVTLIVAKGQGHNYWEGFFRCEPLVEFVIQHAKAGAENAK